MMTQSKPILVVGAQGMLGGAVLRRLGCEPPAELGPLDSAIITATGNDSIASIDITRADDVARALGDICPSAVINCAAMTDVDGAETKADLAYAVNCEGPRNLARGCAAAAAKLIQVSTDFVFDGTKTTPYTEDDAPNPQGVYAASKHEGELAVEAACDDYAIARTAWLYGHGKRNFVERVLELAAGRPRLMGVHDQIGSPTYAADLAEALILLCRSDVRGLFHATNSGSCSRLEWVEETLRLAGISKPVDAVPASTFNLPAPRPAYSVLDCSKLKVQAGYIFRHWKEALAEYFSTRRQPG